ncbi:MAG TPA: hypothetical protein VF465_08960, partial [Flavobacterium sp.]|uniref:hypothetical protein n=1 Tax=Flavobacterium sp. TaxID=239 RepID=UPI002ED240F7
TDAALGMEAASFCEALDILYDTNLHEQKIQRTARPIGKRPKIIDPKSSNQTDNTNHDSI